MGGKNKGNEGRMDGSSIHVGILVIRIQLSLVDAVIVVHIYLFYENYRLL